MTKRNRPRSKSGRREADDGFTLVEILVALIILSLAATSILAGIRLSLSGSTLVVHQADVSVVVTNAAEAVKTDTYIGCQNLAGSSYAVPTSSGEADVNAATDTVTYWNGTTFIPAPTSASCPSPDQVLEQIVVTAAATDGSVTQTLTIVKGNHT